MAALEAVDVLDSDDDTLLVKALSHSDPQVARSAMEKLNARFDSWPNIETAQQFARMRALADSLGRIRLDIPKDNQTYVRSLAARLYWSCVSIGDPQLFPITKICLRVLGTSDSGIVSHDQPQLASLVRTDPPKPLDGYTDTLSDQTTALVETEFRQPQTSRRSSDFGQSNQPTANLPTGASVPLVPVSNSSEASARISDEPPIEMSLNDSPPSELPVMVQTPASIASQPIARMKLVSNQPNLHGIEKAEIAELVRLLSNANPDIAKAATIALKHKGFSDFEVELASELAVGSVSRRLELVQQVATSNQVVPQPWLVWMAEDGQPEVRRMAISLLSSMLDRDVDRSLRLLMDQESDPEIKDQIRKVLLSKR